MSDKHILVIDDDDNIRVLLELELTDMDYQVTTADNAPKGLNLIKQQDFNLVILDIKMPGMDGIEALEKIISHKRNLPVIIHTSFSHFRDNYLTWSATAYVVKSGDLTQLKNKVAEILSPKA